MIVDRVDIGCVVPGGGEGLGAERIVCAVAVAVEPDGRGSRPVIRTCSVYDRIQPRPLDVGVGRESERLVERVRRIRGPGAPSSVRSHVEIAGDRAVLNRGEAFRPCGGRDILGLCYGVASVGVGRGEPDVVGSRCKVVCCVPVGGEFSPVITCSGRPRLP
ncbi:hypothetical protein DSECCO2_318140 [anaerobic digester metagenome]